MEMKASSEGRRANAQACSDGERHHEQHAENDDENENAARRLVACGVANGSVSPLSHDTTSTRRLDRTERTLRFSQKPSHFLLSCVQAILRAIDVVVQATQHAVESAVVLSLKPILACFSSHSPTYETWSITSVPTLMA